MLNGVPSSIRGGAIVALLVPALFLVLAVLGNLGILSIVPPYLRSHGMAFVFTADSAAWLSGLFGPLAESEVVLGPIGLVIAGRGAHLSTPLAWFVLFLLGGAGLFLVWFGSVFAAAVAGGQML